MPGAFGAAFPAAALAAFVLSYCDADAERQHDRSACKNLLCH